MFKCVSVRAQSAIRPCWFAVRHVSSKSNPYPFPRVRNPTPYQIFHLPPTASREQVKARYYDLVRIYHPDSAISRAVSPETAHLRFQAISSAYAVLSGKAQRMTGAESGTEGVRSDYHNLSTAMWRARQRKRAELNVGMDERWKDALMLSAVILTVAAFVWQTFSARRQAMSEAIERSLPYPSSSRSSVRKAAVRPDSLDESLLAEPTQENTARKD